jgi:hypothetical protein
MEKTATGYAKLAINLESHIRFYKPHNWVVPIHNVASTPLFSDNEAQIFMTAYRSGILKSQLEELAKNENTLFNQLKPWYIREAIIDFFAKKEYASYESEL